MKKILTLVLALALAFMAKAEYVRPDVAARYAQGVLGMKEMPEPENAGSLRVAGRNANATVPEYYIFNNPQGGWAIIAADDRVNPVLGYSPEGSFNPSDMPDNVQWWMDGVAETIDAVRESGMDVPESVKAAWESMLKGETPESQKKELRTANWSQEEPYNNLCPIATGENVRSLTGCVATAMAVVMRYNCWPAQGKGVIGGYTTRNGTYIPAYSIDNHKYEWDKMPLNTSSDTVTGWSVKQINQVATLMHDCGVAAHMSYSSESSGTSSGDMLKAIKANMSYSESAVLVCRSSYSQKNWFSIIRNEIDNDRVVFYSAVAEAGGHAFVCDGYDTNGPKLHINWGWGGECNGYYTLDLTIPEYDLVFSDKQEAIIGLVPDTVDVELGETPEIVCIDYNDFYGIEPLIPADITMGSEFNFKAGWFYNSESRDKTVEFKICLEDKDNNVKQEGWYLSINMPASNGYIYSDETEKTTLAVSPELTDHFRLYFKNSKGDWKPMNGNYDILPDVEGVICGVIPDPVIIVPDVCSAGDEIELSLLRGFTHIKPGAVKWSLNGADVDKNEKDDNCRITLVHGRNAIRADVEYIDGSKGSVFRTLQIE